MRIYGYASFILLPQSRPTQTVVGLAHHLDQIMSSELKAGIVGVAGYTGAELVRLIHAHPKLSLCWVAGHSTAGQVLGDVLPSVRGLPALASLVVHAVDVEQPESLPELDVVFVALPHAASAKVGAAFFRKGVQVVDL